VRCKSTWFSVDY